MKILVLLLLSITLVVGCDKTKNRGIVYMPDMVVPVPYEAYSENPITKDHQTMQMPVAGTIARGKMPHHYTNSEEDSIKAGKELSDPYTETKETLERGKEVFTTFCVTCHGEKGLGNGQMVSKNFPPPPSFLGERVMPFTKGRIFHVITMGYNYMPSYGNQVARDDRWYAAQYVKHLQSSK